ncbi:hyoscyamine 6-dioxygenase-like [Chenopodium quinoa]|uniref:Fe2OG dioxygenase domain-containing protein n=1 Tax=Chenopodium quinoa TaxID=63459 RepID=A0A803L8Z3_CHEQI|nr:hyoscyamine 6-dioxygenase-like [Chenopodium quinoa]
MDKFVSTWSDGKTLPENYVFSTEMRPGEHVPVSKNIPVIDLGKAVGLDRKETIQKIIEASQEFGFFQVINHGVPQTVIDDARTAYQDFFDLPTEEKLKLCSSDISQKCIYYTSNVVYDEEDIHAWRDSLRHFCSPLEECIHSWPQKPTKYREVVGKYVTEVNEMGTRILELISEGLKLGVGYFANELSQEQYLSIHCYPPCPDPSLTLGLRPHCDTGLITILLQGTVAGLQTLTDGQWIGVEPILDAFVINIGYQLQIVSNGKLHSVEHRAVTNKDETRMTAAFFIEPKGDCIVEPAKALINAENPPIYKSVKYAEFVQVFREAYLGKIKNALEPYMITSTSSLSTE